MRTQATMLIAGIFICLCGALSAQTQPPRIASVSPVGAACGTKTTVTLEGINVAQTTGIRIEGEGITASAPTLPVPAPAKNTSGKVTFEFAIAPNALPGRRALRLITPLGASDIGYFVIDKYPILDEKEPNNSRETPQQVNITSPVTLVGKIDPGEDVDYLKFTGKKGQTLIADLHAARIGSALDSVLILQDDKGRELAQNEDRFGADSFLAYTFSADGTYLLRIHDLRYQGGGNLYYRLALGIIPNVVTAVFPAGGQSGATPSLELVGYNFGTSRAASLPLARTDHALSSSVFLPMGSETTYNAIRLQTGTLSEVREAEPNDTRETAQRITQPTTINGRTFRANSKAATDRDFFRFRAEKGQRLFLEVTARRLGSPMDSSLTLYDSMGKELSSNDDAEGKDSRIDFTAPESGDYVLQVSELTQRMGENFVYRLSIAPPVQDYTLSFSPDAITIGKGGRVPVTVTANRLNGFNEAINFTFPNLPQGVQIVGMPTLAPGQNETTLFFTAAPDAPPATSPLTLQSSAMSAAKTLSRTAAPSAEFYTKNGEQIVRNTRPSLLAAIIITPMPDLIVSLSADNLMLNPGKTAELTVKIVRAEGFKAKVPLIWIGLPQGVSIAPAEVPENLSEVKVTVKAEANAPLGTSSLICTARVVFEELRFNTHAAPPLVLTLAK